MKARVTKTGSVEGLGGEAVGISCTVTLFVASRMASGRVLQYDTVVWIPRDGLSRHAIRRDAVSAAVEHYLSLVP